MPVAHAENIADKLDQEMKEWNIRSEVVAATNDNGQNVVNAMEKLELLTYPVLGTLFSWLLSMLSMCPLCREYWHALRGLSFIFVSLPKPHTNCMTNKLCLVSSRAHSRMNV